MKTRSLNKTLLQNLLQTISPSGNEEDMISIWFRETKPFADEVYTDNMGSAHAVLNSNSSRKVIISAHCDEIGFIVKSISSNGFLTIGTIGGWDPQVAVGQHVCINTKNGKVFGVIGKKPIHQQEDKKSASKIKELFVDIGTKSKTEAEKIVSIGDVMVIDHGFIELQNDMFSCRGCDDKVGVFIILETLRRLASEKLNVAVEGIATVQEEVGTRGIQPAVYATNADIGFVVDVTFANDHPNSEKDTDIALGKGAVITKGPHINKKLVSLVENTAQINKIPHQIAAIGQPYGTDTEPLQRVKTGIISSLISIPCRYMHSPSETCNYNDVQSIIDLLTETIKQITPDMSFKFE